RAGSGPCASRYSPPRRSRASSPEQLTRASAGPLANTRERYFTTYMQCPSTQLPPSQELWHPPQCFGSKRVSTQAPLHATRRSPQPQLPLTQIEPASHALLHAPQLSGLVLMSTQ